MIVSVSDEILKRYNRIPRLASPPCGAVAVLHTDRRRRTLMWVALHFTAGAVVHHLLLVLSQVATSFTYSVAI